jgi:CDP-diacylglycerol--serine O-phosphatidyltransferase
MTLGLVVIFLVSGTNGQPGSIALGCLLILIGAFVDSIDGRLARYLNSTTDLGKQLDSFSDLITFGLAPISIIWQLGLLSQSVGAFLALGLFPLAGAFRLARYNIGEYEDYFEGLPITAAGSILSLYVLGYRYFFNGVQDSLPVVVTLGLVVILAGLMVGKFKVRRIGLQNIQRAHYLTVESNGQTEGYKL